MSDLVWIYVIVGSVSLFSCGISLWALKISRFARQTFESEQLAEAFKGASENALRDFESRMKAIETEWETVYDKFDRLTKRRGGGLGGRPPKVPDELPAEALAEPPKTDAMSYRREIMARARGQRRR